MTHRKIFSSPDFLFHQIITGSNLHPAALIIMIIMIFSSCAGAAKPLIEYTAVPDELPAVYPARWYGGHHAACSVTFDDGTLDQYLLGAPELDRRGIKGTFFIITGLRDEGFWPDGSRIRKLFSWDQARDLAWRGHEIASHTSGHADLAALPDLAGEEIEKAYLDLKREIPWISRFSFGWPYWRSSASAELAAADFHHAARSGGVSTDSGSIDYGGVSGKSPLNFMRIGSRGILSSDSTEDIRQILDKVYENRGWFIPNFHGIDDSIIDNAALGWDAVSLENFRQMLDIIRQYDIWFAPFGEAARYIRQRDALELEAAWSGKILQVRYSSSLDPEIYNHYLTLTLDLPGNTMLDLAAEAETGTALQFVLKDCEENINRYLIDLPPGSGLLSIKIKQPEY